MEQNLADYLDDLRWLVGVDCGTHNKIGVDQVGRWVADRMREWGWKVEHHRQEVVGDCWSGSLNGNGKARLILVTHLDTVYENGIAAKCPMARNGNKLIGPGVSDMKSGLLSAMWALRALQLQGYRDFEEIMLYCNSDEETGSVHGSEMLMSVASRCHAAFVLEAGRLNGDIVSSRKGIAVYTLRVHGCAAHSGIEFEKGTNAIVELAHQILSAASLNGMEPGVTVNVGTVAGGTKWNVVPDYAEAVLEVRATSCGQLQACDQQLHRMTETVTVPGTRAEIDGRIWPAMPKSDGAALLVRLAQAAGEDVGIPINDNESIVGGVSDANYVAATGVPVIDGLGPIGGGDHSPDEFVLLDTIVPRTAMLAGLLDRACGKWMELENVRSNPDELGCHFRVSRKLGY